jgi:hypothetical protein
MVRELLSIGDARSSVKYPFFSYNPTRFFGFVMLFLLLLFLTIAMTAGTLSSNHDNRRGEMMFWLFEPTTQVVPDTMVIWYDFTVVWSVNSLGCTITRIL